MDVRLAKILITVAKKDNPHFFRVKGRVTMEVPDPTMVYMNLETGEKRMARHKVVVKRQDLEFKNDRERQFWRYWCRRANWGDKEVADYPLLTAILKDIMFEQYAVFEANKRLWEYNEMVKERFGKLSTAALNLVAKVLEHVPPAIIKDHLEVYQALSLMHEVVKVIEPPCDQDLQKRDLKRLKSARNLENIRRKRDGRPPKIYLEDPE